jgi:hypothetical protein
LKSIQASPSFFSATAGPTASSSKKSPSGPLPAPSLVPPSPFVTQPTQPPVVNHDKAIANLSAELVSNFVESSIAQVAQNTLLKKSLKASAEDKRRTENVISHFSRNIETLVLSEVVRDVVFDLAASSLLAKHHAKRQRALLISTFQKWMTISRSYKSRLSWKGSNSARVQSLVSFDITQPFFFIIRQPKTLFF